VIHINNKNNKTVKPGFSLIEVIYALMILSTAFFFSLQLFTNGLLMSNAFSKKYSALEICQKVITDMAEHPYCVPSLWQPGQPIPSPCQAFDNPTELYPMPSNIRDETTQDYKQVTDLPLQDRYDYMVTASLPNFEFSDPAMKNKDKGMDKTRIIKLSVTVKGPLNPDGSIVISGNQQYTKEATLSMFNPIAVFDNSAVFFKPFKHGGVL
jgi:type II secretory pathway pseudopilin PulG